MLKNIIGIYKDNCINLLIARLLLMALVTFALAYLLLFFPTVTKYLFYVLVAYSATIMAIDYGIRKMKDHVISARLLGKLVLCVAASMLFLLVVL